MIRPVLPEELEMVCRRITSMEPWLTLGVTAEDLTTGLRLDNIRQMLVYDDGVGICGAVVYRATLGAEMLFFCGFGELLAKHYNVDWPCKWQDVPDMGYIGSLAVFNGGTGRGIGLKLIQAAQEKIQQAGQTVAYLSVSDFNTGAQRFYKRHGYERVGVITGRRSVEHLMGKALE